MLETVLAKLKNFNLCVTLPKGLFTRNTNFVQNYVVRHKIWSDDTTYVERLLCIFVIRHKIRVSCKHHFNLQQKRFNSSLDIDLLLDVG
jgi:hypothetical protein